ncbi:MAG TPA: type IIL restriction-modification enzyme MmeI [Chloroflexia bacterium]|nr:type IIL restriction-modification enzyme MmeI [Chloroflexia bacterium]
MYTSSTLADLYDPSTMPEVLTKAHRALDKAVDWLTASRHLTPSAAAWNTSLGCISNLRPR